jgi:hypothetical protein
MDVLEGEPIKSILEETAEEILPALKMFKDFKLTFS